MTGVYNRRHWENTLGEQAGADITGLEQVVEFEKAA